MDPDFYEEIYASSSRKRDKDPEFYASLISPFSTVGTVDHGHHSLRRGILSKRFSKRAIVEIEPLIKEQIDEVCRLLEKAHRDGSVVDLIDLFSSMTSETIIRYVFGENDFRSQDPIFRKGVLEAVTGLMNSAHPNRVPLLRALSQLTPPWLSRMRQPKLEGLLRFQSLLHQSSIITGEGKPSVSAGNTIASAMADPSVPWEEKTAERFQDEGVQILIAGTEATARPVAVALFYLSEDRTMRSKLRQELQQVMPSPDSSPTSNELMKLPFLVSVSFSLKNTLDRSTHS